MDSQEKSLPGDAVRPRGVEETEPSAVRGVSSVSDNFFGSISVAGDRLAVLSYKTGRLRLVDPSPEAYRERAYLDVLNAGAVNYVWPAFADGTIFVRNQEEMVAVAVGDEEPHQKPGRDE